ncbi:MAG TPA: tyrosine-type recombinase/integrase [Terriglobales bacterium]|nr:tyrosine-type recombinase/integrase [Terriglobales bacterium]
MKRTRHQKGYLYKKGNLWLLRYYDNQELPDGGIIRVQKAQKLVEAVGDYRTKASARQLADEFLAPLNDSRMTPQSVMSLGRFVEGRYLPFVETHKRISTYHGYRNTWKRYLQQYGGIALRDFRTADVERILESILRANDLTSTTLQHIKAFMSGVFRYAKRQGVIHSDNPVRDAVLPKARPAEDTFAYSLELITQMLHVLPEPAATIVAAAAFTGARKGELRGFRWEGYDGEQIRISQSYWRSHRQEPKTRKSRAPVPVITQLAERLNLHRELSGNPSSGLIFQSPAGKPMNLDALARDVIRPALNKHGLEWHGWHAFRRGLATNLHRLGVPDETIQRILRHSTVAVTQNCYIKTADADAVAAMRSLENAPSMHLGSPKRPQVM